MRYAPKEVPLGRAPKEVPLGDASKEVPSGHAPQKVPLRNRLRGGIATTLPVALAVGVTLAIFGYARVPLNLFNWLALMLVLGVGANYAVFLREGCLRADADLGAVWTGVLLSAATTLLSFGMLGMSAMPALKSFGATLALGIAVAVLLAPIGMPSESRRAA
jgi:predicted exporter